MAKEIPQRIIELASEIEKTLDNDASTITENVPGEVYERTLPEGITIEVVDRIQSHNADFVASGVLAFHAIAMRQMVENKDCANISGKLQMGKRSFVEVAIDREHNWKDHLHDGEDKIRYGATTVKLVTGGDKKTTQPLKSVMDEIATISLEQLGPKPF